MLLLVAPRQARPQAEHIDSAPVGTLEVGSPPFSVIGAESLGLESPPADMHLLPDGRVLVYAPHQLVFGDGVRWQMFRQKPHTSAGAGTGVAVDKDGSIYVATRNTFDVVKLTESGLWEPVPASKPGSLTSDYPVPRVALEVGDQWIWHSGSGVLISWRPGQDARIMGHAEDVQHVFEFRGSVYFSDRNSGGLYRIVNGIAEAVFPLSNASPADSVSCSVAYSENEILLGTAGRGVLLFDGNSMRPFLRKAADVGGARVNDICDAGNGYYAAAVENRGIIFFNSAGRLLQVVGGALDSRLSRVNKLIAAPGGVVWALLENAVARVEFPSRVSSFEALIGTPMVSGHPYRYEGGLWVQTDGKAFRGVYDADGRLTQLVRDQPNDEFVFSLFFDTGVPMVGTASNVYYRTGRGWLPFAPGIADLRILDSKPVDGRWLYGARGEIGWLRLGPKGVEVERIPVPGLGNLYNCSVDGEGHIWMELGTGRLGRLRLKDGVPSVEIFTHKDGVPEGWAQVFVLNGKAGFNIADKILKFDEARGRFVEDEGFAREFPQLHEVVGRPGIDSQGRLWISANGRVNVLEKRGTEWHEVEERTPAGFNAQYFTFESGGVVWMHGNRLLLRYDPYIPEVEAVPLRALITHVTLAASNRTLFGLKDELAPLDSSDNSLAAYFVAPGNLYTAPVSFDVKLEGADSEWVSVGSSGSALFNRLKEGHYVLHVRPEAAGRKGTEATLAFSVLPPWYRTGYAYAGYVLSGTLAVILSIWLMTELQRRKNAGLERLVTLRTKELNESNARLASQVEDIRMLSQVVEQSPISILITRPDGSIVFANPHLCTTTGYKLQDLEGANCSLLRSELVSPELIAEIAATVQGGQSWHGQLTNRRADGSAYHVRTTVAPIRAPGGGIPLHIMLEEDITEWLGDQERRKRLEDQLFQSQKLESLGTLAGGIAHDFNNILTGIMGYCELARLGAGANPELVSDLERIHSAGLRARDLVAQILTFSRRSTVSLLPLDIAAPVAEAMRLVQASTPSTVEIVRRLESGVVRADSTQIQQVVLNLCTNAVHAMQGKPGRLEVSTSRIAVDSALLEEVPELHVGTWMRLTVSDNGHGMEPGMLRRIFDPFFTTKKPGEGTGLGLAIVQGIMAGHEGVIRVRSTPGEGTTFDLYFPVSGEAVANTASTATARRGSGEEILLVDDEPTVMDFASKRLRLFGYSVTAFHDSREALAAFMSTPDRFQALVTDLTMPQITGIDLARRIRATGSMMPIVIMTGYGRNFVSSGGEAIPRCIVVNKPFVGEDLARALGQLFGSRAGPAK